MRILQKETVIKILDLMKTHLESEKDVEGNFTFNLKDSKNPYDYCVSGNLMFSKLGPLKDYDNSPYSRCEIIQNDEEGVRVIW
jgi:hypothetical protein